MEAPDVDDDRPVGRGSFVCGFIAGVVVCVVVVIGLILLYLDLLAGARG